MVTVTDTGVGVPPEDRERIFESFQQGGRGAPKEEGTGLGLTLTRRIVELFGGRLWMESEVGVGSTFGFAIPVGVARSTPAHRASTSERGELADVLLVDDDRASARPAVGLPRAARRSRSCRCHDGARGAGGGGREPPAARPARHPSARYGRLGAAASRSRRTRRPSTSRSSSSRSSTSARRGLALGASGLPHQAGQPRGPHPVAPRRPVCWARPRHAEVP